jgi:hypothetical protein
MTAPTAQEGGQKIFPVKANAKTPLTPHGFKDASSDPAQIARWGQEFPGCNWGMPTGEIVVLDLDAKHPESLEWWQEQQDIHGQVITYEVVTPSGGSHLYFLAPEGIELKSTASEIAPGVDTRAKGGYVVIPPSIIHGNAYEVVNHAPIAGMPSWLLALWPKVGEPTHREYSPNGRGVNGAVGRDLLNTPLPEGRRNIGLAAIAGYLWNRLETLQELEAQLLDANARLCCPPLLDDEVLAIARSISRYPKANPDLLQGAIPRERYTPGGQARFVDPPIPQICDGEACQAWVEGMLWLPCTKFGSVLRHYLNGQKDRLLAHLKSMGEAETYSKLAHCWEFYRELICQTTELPYLVRFHCGVRGCSLCAIWVIERFFEEKEGMLAQLTRPAVYRVSLGSQRIGPFPQQKENQIKALYTEVRKMVTHLSGNGVLRDFLYGIRAHVRGEVISVELDLLCEYGRDLEAQLVAHFTKETGVRAYVQRIPCADRREAQRVMSMAMAVPLVWDSPEDYSVWRAATKGTKLIQGKGKFYKVAGGAAKKKPSENAPNSPCPICRRCNPVARDGFYPVQTTQTREVVSPLTGETYIERVSESPPEEG